MNIIRSTESKLILFIGALSVMISSIKKFNTQKFLIQIILFFLLVRDTDCLIHRDCKIPTITIYILPIMILMYFVMEYIFYDRIDKIKKKVSNTIGNLNHM